MLQRFMGANPYEIIRQPNLKSGKIVYVVEKATPVPLPLLAATGDVLQSLRTALDYIACALVPGCRQGLSTSTYFPILNEAPTPEQLKTAFDGKVKGIKHEALEKIASLKPYKGGDDILWRLHALNKIDKHRLLVAAGCSVSRITREPLKKPINFDPEDIAQALSDTIIPIPGGFPLYEGQELLVDPPSPELNENMKLLGEVAINEPQVIEGRPLIVILRESYRRVVTIVGDFVPLLKR
jgi:hypothetical protein